MRSRSEARYAALLALSTAFFVAVAVAALAWEEGAEADVRFVRWVHRTAPEWLVHAMRVLTSLGSGWFLATVALATAVVLVRRSEARAAAFVVIAFAASELVDQALKAAFRRARPELDDPFLRLTTYSFPSGHAFASTATYGALALVLVSVAPRLRRTVVAAAAAALVVIVAASRVVLGVHYLFDVLAGISGGIALLSALLLLFRGRVVVGASHVPGKEHAQGARLDA